MVISDNRILFRASRNLVYDARLGNGCDGLTRSPYEPLISHSRSLFCSGDTVEVADVGRNGSCTITSISIWQPG